MTAETTDRRACILLYGEDEPLVRTRGWVLEKAGFEMRTALTPTLLERIISHEPLDMVILCDSLRTESRQAALTLLQHRKPAVQQLILTGLSDPAGLSPEATLFPASEGPRKLLDAVSDLLRHTPDRGFPPASTPPASTPPGRSGTSNSSSPAA